VGTPETEAERAACEDSACDSSAEAAAGPVPAPPGPALPAEGEVAGPGAVSAVCARDTQSSSADESEIVVAGSSARVGSVLLRVMLLLLLLMPTLFALVLGLLSCAELVVCRDGSGGNIPPEAMPGPVGTLAADTAPEGSERWFAALEAAPALSVAAEARAGAALARGSLPPRAEPDAAVGVTAECADAGLCRVEPRDTAETTEGEGAKCGPKWRPPLDEAAESALGVCEDKDAAVAWLRKVAASNPAKPALGASLGVPERDIVFSLAGKC